MEDWNQVLAVGSSQDLLDKSFDRFLVLVKKRSYRTVYKRFQLLFGYRFRSIVLGRPHDLDHRRQFVSQFQRSRQFFTDRRKDRGRIGTGFDQFRDAGKYLMDIVPKRRK